MSYLILDTPLLQGSTLREGKVTVLDSTGQTLTNYITEIVKKDDQYLLAFCDVNTGCSSDEGGDTVDGEQGSSGNEGSGDNQGGNSGSDDKPITPSPNTPPSSDPIYNAIYEALDGSIINNNNLIRTAASTVEKQIETMQDERKTYQGNLIHHNMLGRIAHLSSRNNNSFAFNRNTNNYALSKSNSRIETEGMYLDGFNYSLGLYSRVYMPYSLELDTLAYYQNNHNKYDRTFAGLSSIHKGDYKRHNIGAQARLGYRFEFVNENSLKPYLGILSSSYYVPEYKENGLLPISRSTNTFTSLYGVLGIEYRKILDSGSFFISLEGVNGKAVFGDKNYEMSIGQEKISYENEKELFANLFAGANFSVSKHLDFTASVMS